MLPVLHLAAFHGPLFGVSLFGGVAAHGARARAVPRVEQVDRATRLPWASLVFALAVSLGLWWQWHDPRMLGLLQRDATQVRAGEAWRLLTSLCVQDGGLWGGAFNIACLLWLGPVAERRWGAVRWAAVAFGGALAGELAGLAWQPIGAGNSVLNFALAGGLAATGFADPPVFPRVLATLGLAASLGLVAMADVHGAAALAGAAMATLLRPRLRR